MLTDDLIATFSSAQAAFTERVHAVAPDQWRLATPDTQWTVADLAGHLVDEHRWAAPLLAGLDMDAARVVVAGLGPAGADGTALVRAWDQAAASSAAAFRADGALTGSAAIYPLAQAIVDRTPAGMFDPPVDVGADAPVIDRLVALTGRRPRPA
jgi:hypothetical protein